jgi:tetratricopeptide (TPR) repeat protein
MGVVASTPLFEDNQDLEADVLLNGHSCYQLLDFPRQLLVLQPSQQVTGSSRAPILTASSCDEDEDEYEYEEMDSLGGESEPLEAQHQVCAAAAADDDAAAADDDVTETTPSRRQRQPRLFDLYETDSTLVVPLDDDEEEEEATSAATTSEMTLPFRRCTRRYCSCCSAANTRQRVSSQHHRQQQQQQQQHEDQNLLGLSILPMLSTSISDVSEVSSSSSRHQRTQQVRSDASLQKSNHSSTATPTTCTNKPPRLPKSPKRRRPLLGGGPGRGRARSEDFVEEGNIFHTSDEPQTITNSRVRSRSEDLVEGNNNSTLFSMNINNNQMDDALLSERKLRARSEDFVDFPGPQSSSIRRNRASSTPPALLLESPTTSTSMETAPTTGKRTSGVLPKSPTSVMHHEFPTVPSAPKTSAPSEPSSSVSHAEALQSQGCYTEARNEYRQLLSTLPNLSSHKKADLYHLIAWTHYQESRYSAALCVVKHALEVLQLAHGCLTLEGLMNALSSSSATTVTTTCRIADLILTQARVHASLDDVRQAKQFAKMALQMLMEKQNHDDSTSQIIFAKGLLILGKAYATPSNNNNNNNTDQRAMQHYHQALQIFSYFHLHLYVAETIHLMGEASPSHLANSSYSQALMIRYRHHQDHQQPQDDIATTLTRLGWNALAQGRLESALELSQQALERTTIPRNVASIQYQMGLIHSRLGNSDEALRKWKKTLKIQRSIFARGNHVDTARTCEVIAIEYQRLQKYDRARDFFEGALEIYDRPEHVARIQSRLAHHFVAYEKNAARAKRAWNKASRIYKRERVPMDDVAVRAKKAVSVLKKPN